MANKLTSSFDVTTVTTSNDFVTALLHQESVVKIVEQAKSYLALSVGVLACYLGLLAFGIGMILSRIKTLAGRVSAAR